MINNSEKKLVLVIPCFNEEARLSIHQIKDFLEKNKNISFCLVNDGSSDETGKIINDLASINSNQIVTKHLPKNKGKGEAVRQGILYSSEIFKASWLGFWDADLATPLNEIETFLNYSEKYLEIDFFLGSRVSRLGSCIKRRANRHYSGRIMATGASLILGLPVYDTQCGAKMIKTSIATELFANPFISPWLFDVELIARFVKKWGHSAALERLYEIPISSWSDVEGSKISLKSFLVAPWHLFLIKWHYNLVRH